MVTNKNKTINEVIIVEGKTDSNRLQSLFDVQTIETNGLALSNDVKKLITAASNHSGIIIFCDPDGPGEKIRRQVQELVPSAKHCFINKKEFANRKKIGVAEANDAQIIQALENVVTFDKQNSSITYSEYLELELDTKVKRQQVCDKLKISYCNHKQLYKRLNMLGIAKIQLEEILNEHI